MARMIPPYTRGDCPSRGEIEIFRRLKGDPAAQGWTVLHSLDIAHHLKRISGEIDFVVIVPSKGVLCLEVKACSSLVCKDGLWYYGTESKADPLGPFKQVSGAMHSLRKEVAQKRPDLAGIVFWSAVVFPYVDFSVKSEEWHSWQVIDRCAFKARSLAELVDSVLNKARNHLTNCYSASWFNPKSQKPNQEQCRLLAEIMRPNFEFFESPKSASERKQAELKHYTKEQFMILDAMELNARVAFVGPAGTGKTMLAIEAARRGGAAGRRVLLLCFNKLLGRWLEHETADLRPLVAARTLHKHMRSLGCRVPDSAQSSFWEDELPLLAMEKVISASEDENIYDELVIDEGQDILLANYLDFLDLSLRGGLTAGRWRFFGDFEKQMIYGEKGISLDDFLKEKGSNAPIFSLRVNCRNTPRVATLTELLGRMVPGYKKVLRPDNRIEPELKYFANNKEQEQMLVETLGELYENGFTGNDIAVLSPKADNSCASKIGSCPWKDRLRPSTESDKGFVSYCSIHAFKGLEAPAVIVTDISKVLEPAANALFYVAITRALHKLVILLHVSVKKEIVRILSSELIQKTADGGSDG